MNYPANNSIYNYMLFIVKCITYFDTDDLNSSSNFLFKTDQVGGADRAPDKTDSVFGAADTDDIVDGVNVSKDNNFVIYVLRTFIDVTRRVGLMVSQRLGKIALIFIFAATLPALPFFLTMGLMYALVKYAMLKFRTL